MALVTGGTGFVGSHVVDVLLEAGYAVRCTVRQTSNLRWLEGKPVELVEADLRGPGLDAAVSGVDLVFHFAGLTRGSGRALQQANFEGTQALSAVCATHSLGIRFVFCSSQAAAGSSRPGVPRAEDDPPEPTTEYGSSKLAAERAVLDQIGKLEPVVLRPSAIYGPRDEDTLPYFKMAAKGVMIIPGVRERRIQMVHARDVAGAALLAAEAPVAVGRTYFIAHPEVLTWSSLAHSIADAVGRRVVPIRIPSPILRAIGTLASAFGAGGSPGQIDKRRAADLTELDWTCRVDRALDELGWSPRFDVQRGLQNTADWYRDQGWL